MGPNTQSDYNVQMDAHVLAPAETAPVEEHVHQEPATEGVYKWICGILAAVLMTGLAAWFSFGGGVSRQEVIDLIDTRAPYREDRKMLIDKLERIERELKEVRSELRDLRERTHGTDNP